MAKRTKQAIPANKAAGGVRVVLRDNSFLNFPTAVGWNVGAEGVLYIASAEKIEQDSRLVNALLATFREWAHVTWL